MFFTHKTPAIELFRDFADCHSHILPGVDDGVQSIDESLEVLSYYESLGVRKVIFTPHIMEEYPLNSASTLRAEFAKFQERYRGSIELSLAAEYMLDGRFMEHLKSGDLLTLYDNHLLVEMSCVDAFINIFSMVKEIMSRGYFVTLAHPERYLYLKPTEYSRLKQMGVKFQLNLPSLLGSYGPHVKSRAESLLKDGMYEIIGSDIHSLKYHSRVINGTKVSKRVAQRIEKIK